MADFYFSADNRRRSRRRDIYIGQEKKNLSFVNKKMPTKLLKIIIFIVVILTLSPKAAEAAGASLSVFPQTGTFTVGNTFDVSVFVNSGGNDVNAVRVDLKFDPEKLQVITPAKGVSVVGEWVFPPSFSNKKGTITLKGGFPGRGINTSEGLITVIVFKAVSSGETTVNFLDSSQVLLSDEKGTDILSSFNRGAYNIIPSPPKGPRIFSETHPDQNRWYRSPNPGFSWDKIGGAEGYSYQLDDDPFGEPDNIINSQSVSVSFEDIDEGVQYFHLKAKRRGAWGGTSHFKIMVDKTPPAKFKPRLATFRFTAGYLLIYFDTEDGLSGLDYYQAKLADYSDRENTVWSGWMEEESPFKLSTEKKGTFQLFIRAFDKAGNFSEEKIQVKVFSPVLILVSGGIQIRGLFLPWWLIVLVLGAILLGLGYLIYRRVKEKTELVGVDLEKEIKEAEKEIEDVRKAKEKIRGIRLLEERGKAEWQRLKSTLKKIINPPEDKKDE